MKRIALLLLVCGMLLPACKNKKDLESRVALFEQEMASYREQTDNVGMTVVFIEDNAIAYVRHFGAKNLERNEPLDDRSLFRVASMSKTFVGTGLMQMVAEGKVSLTDDISDLLGETVRNPLFPAVPITLEMLLSHTSSINDDEGFNTYAPGQGMMYCDRNYTLAGKILTRLSGERFDLYVQHHILEPLGLYGGYDITLLDRRRLASLYQWNGEGYMCVDELAYGPALSPASGMKMSAVDMAKYVLMHMNYGTSPEGVVILPEDVSRDMQRPRSEITLEHFGLGLLQTDEYSPGVMLVGHLGGAYGMRGGMFFNPEKKYGFVVMSNGAHDTQKDDENMIHKGTLTRMYRCFIGEE